MTGQASQLGMAQLLLIYLAKFFCHMTAEFWVISRKRASDMLSKEVRVNAFLRLRQAPM